MRTKAVILASILAATLAPSTAQASKNYPQVLESFWRVRGLPVKSGQGCMLCHKSDAGGKGTTTRPFGLTLKNKGGTIGASERSLQRGLDYVRVHATNSDGDPVSDYQEIVVDGTDPNDRNDYVPPPPPPPPRSDGGQGGERSTGDAGSSAEGGTTAVVVTQTDYPPSPPSELPPAYVHGCTLNAHGRQRSGTIVALVALGFAVLGRRRRWRLGPGRL